MPIRPATNQALYPRNTKGSPHFCSMNRCAVPICSIVIREGVFNHEANIVAGDHCM